MGKEFEMGKKVLDIGKYCTEVCRCAGSENGCDKTKCPIWCAAEEEQIAVTDNMAEDSANKTLDRKELLELIDKELQRMPKTSAVKRAFMIFQDCARKCTTANIKRPILYECNRKKCEICSQECSHTDDIRFAKNFYGLGGSLFERSSESLKHSGGVDQILSAVVVNAEKIAQSLEKAANCIENISGSDRKPE